MFLRTTTTPARPKLRHHMKCHLVRWINRRLTFEHVAIVAKAGNIEMRSLVALHPALHVPEELERVAA